MEQFGNGRFSGKKVVITGGSSGFGLATAKLLADEGARVLITGRTQATLDAAREQLGNNAIAVLSDAASSKDIATLAERVKAEFGTIDALFVNAGVGRFAPFESVTEETYDEVFTINAKGPYRYLGEVNAEGSCRTDQDADDPGESDVAFWRSGRGS